MKRIIFILQLIMAALTVNAQTLTVNVPSGVRTGENFRLTYTVNTQNATDFRIGSMPSALEIITGPYTSSQSSFQMVNGHTSSSSSITYTYIICANKAGIYTVPAAHVSVNGKTFSSHAVKIKVSGSAADTGGAPKMHDDEGASRIKEAGSAISGTDLFIKVSASKRHVHEQEPIMLTYKVYTLVELTQLEPKMPDLTGFHTQEVKLPQQKSFHIEKVNGRNYRCVTWSQYVLYPQMTGKLEIPGFSFNCTVVQQNRNVDPFEAFFNGGSGYIEVKRTIKAPGLTIQVDPLPNRPDNFSGGVGKFNISAQLNKKEIRAGEPLTLRVVVGGNGNLKLIKQPVVKFPKDFDTYDAKITDKTRLASNGLEGNMVYDFIAVPRNQGTYTIPPVEFTYYDTGINGYKTIKTQPFQINVQKGDGNSVSADDNEFKSKDIRPIKTGRTTYHGIEELFFGSVTYWALITIIFVAFVVLLILFRQRAIQNADIVGMRIKKANKVATRRLRIAYNLMRQHKQSEFYDEVLRALWGYVGDKLNIPVEQLSRENIAERLSEHNVDSETVGNFVGAIDECEFERYAPGDAAGNMNKTYTSAITAITKIEEAMKSSRNKLGKGFVKVLVAFMLTVPGASHAITKANADAEFRKGNYQQAIKDYEELLHAGPTAELYYNLGNAYYRTDNITRAVLSYERALLLSPSDDDIKFNLEKARSKTIDKINPETEMFFFVWYRALVNLVSVDCWAGIAVFSILMTFVMALFYLFSGSMALRKMGFFVSIGFLFVFIISNIFAYQQKRAVHNNTGAIVTTPSVTLKSTPASNGTDKSVIHEGTRVDITDDTMRDWKCVRLADGREGWIQVSHIEKIWVR